MESRREEAVLHPLVTMLCHPPGFLGQKVDDLRSKINNFGPEISTQNRAPCLNFHCDFFPFPIYSQKTKDQENTKKLFRRVSFFPI